MQTFERACPMRDYVIEERVGDRYSRWNLTQYIKYRQAKNLSSEPMTIDHRFLNCKFKRGDDILRIVQVIRQWHAGFYLLGIYETNDSGSHGTIVIENINSIDPVILGSLDTFHTFWGRYEKY